MPACCEGKRGLSIPPRRLSSHFVAMEPVTLPTPLRLIVLVYLFAQVGVEAQSSVCDGSVTVTYVPPPFTVTVYTSGTFNASNETPSPGFNVTGQSGISVTAQTLSAVPEISTSRSPVEVPSSGLGPSGIQNAASQTLPSSPSSSLFVPSISATTTGTSRTSGTGSTAFSGNSASSASGSISSSITGSPASTAGSVGGASSNAPNTGSNASSGEMSNSGSASPTVPSSSTSSGGPVIFGGQGNQAAQLVVQRSQHICELAGRVSQLVTDNNDAELDSVVSEFATTVNDFNDALTHSRFKRSQHVPRDANWAQYISELRECAEKLLQHFSSRSETGSGNTPSGTSSSTRPTIGTTTSTIPTASVVALLTCPNDDGSNYLSPGGKAFRIECNLDRLGNIISQALEPDLESCIDSCDGVSECTGVSYDTTSGICNYKSDVTSEANQNSQWMSASPIDLACPEADGAQYMDYSGSMYQVLCDYSYPDSALITSYPGDDYASCSDDCSEMAECTGFSYTDGICSFFSGWESTGSSARNGTNTVVLLAKRAVHVAPGGSTVVSTSVASTIPPYSASSPLPVVTGSRASSATATSSIGASSLSPTNGATGSSGTTTETDASSGSSNTPSGTQPSISGGSITLPTSLLSSVTDLSTSIPDISATTGSASAPDVSTLSLTSMSLPSTSLPTASSLPSLSSVSISLPSLSLSTDATSLSINTISLGSSATLPTSQGPTQTPVAYTCPEKDAPRLVLRTPPKLRLHLSTTASESAIKAACSEEQTTAQPSHTREPKTDPDPAIAIYTMASARASLPSAAGRTYITAIRAVNYVPAAVVGGASSALSGLSGLTTITTPSVTLPLTTSLPSISASISVGASVSISDPLNNPGGSSRTSSSSALSLSVTSLDTSLPIPSGSSTLTPITGTCSNGGNILNGCVLVTATVNPGAGVTGGVGVAGPSNSTILDVSLSATLGVSLSVNAGAGVGLGLDSSGLSLGLSATLGAGVSLTGVLGGGLHSPGSCVYHIFFSLRSRNTRSRLAIFFLVAGDLNDIFLRHAARPCGDDDDYYELVSAVAFDNDSLHYVDSNVMPNRTRRRAHLPARRLVHHPPIDQRRRDKY
ncbi:hypothetical protein Q7P37_000593 [Cladosporium fusiforme]